MRTPADYMVLARKTLAFARSVLSEEYADKAGREAYLAGYQAATALILDRTGRVAKTHSGTRSEFARLAQTETTVGREQIAFLGWAYELKTVADYGAEQPIAIGEAERAIREAATLIKIVGALVD